MQFLQKNCWWQIFINLHILLRILRYDKTLLESTLNDGAAVKRIFIMHTNLDTEGLVLITRWQKEVHQKFDK